jgi:hypothetical protein
MTDFSKKRKVKAFARKIRNKPAWTEGDPIQRNKMPFFGKFSACPCSRGARER